jgi:hypothetical protein
LGFAGGSRAMGFTGKSEFTAFKADHLIGREVSDLSGMISETLNDFGIDPEDRVFFAVLYLHLIGPYL